MVRRRSCGLWSTSGYRLRPVIATLRAFSFATAAVDISPPITGRPGQRLWRDGGLDDRLPNISALVYAAEDEWIDYESVDYE